MQYIIREATPADSPAINTLCVEAYREFEASVEQADWQQMQDVLAHASDLSTAGELLVAEDASGLLGVVLYVRPGDSDGISIPAAWASIRMLAVSAIGRGRGIGRRLTQECIERARRDGAEKVGLTTGEIMKNAQRIYQDMGFQKDAELGIRLGVKHARYVLALKQTV